MKDKKTSLNSLNVSSFITVSDATISHISTQGDLRQALTFTPTCTEV